LTVPIALAGAIRLPALDVLAQRFVDALRVAAIAEAGSGRLVPWVPVAFGIGIATYFAAEREPSWIAVLLLASVLAIAGFVARRRVVAFAALVLIAATVIGFAVATLKTALIAHPVLERPLYGASITGFIETHEERERTDRIVIKVTDMDGDRVDRPLERVRLSVRRGAAPIVGSFVRLKARLNPPLPPLRPSGYDFARDLYFQRIGAVGFVTGAIKVENGAINAWAAAEILKHDRRDARCHRSAHPGCRAGRCRRDRLGADHRKAGRAVHIRERRHVHIRSRPRAVDLRLSAIVQLSASRILAHKPAGAVFLAINNVAPRDE
jgi:hypothetical protein